MSWTNSLRNYLHPRVILVLFLGFLSGLPLGLLIDPLNFWLAEIGIKKSTIGLLSLVLLAYSLKMVWAPLVDRLRLPLIYKIGQRRSWLFLSQVLSFISIIVISFQNPSENLQFFVFALILLSFFSATQDICVDALRIELVKKNEIGEASAVYFIGYRIGAVLLSQVITFYIAEYYGWNVAYMLVGILFLIFALTILFFLPEPERDEKSYISIVNKPLTWFKDSFVSPLTDLYSRYREHLFLLLLLTFTYRLSDMFLGPMAMPFYQFIGFSKLEVAEITNFYGLWVTIIGGLFAGLTLFRFGLVKNMVFGALFVPLANLPFMYLNFVGYDIWVLVLTITIDNFSQGFIGVVGITFLSRMVSKTYTATQYALLFGLVAIPPRIISGSSGFIAEDFGFHYFFLICVILGIPAIIFSLMVYRKKEIFGFD